MWFLFFPPLRNLKFGGLPKDFGPMGAHRATEQNTLSLMLAGYKLWPLVSLLQFTVVPVQQRVVVGSLVGVGWGVFLSLLAAH